MYACGCPAPHVSCAYITISGAVLQQPSNFTVHTGTIERRHHEVLELMYNKINHTRQHYLFYLHIRLHVSTHQSVILRPTLHTKSLVLCAHWDPNMFRVIKYIKSGKFLLSFVLSKEIYQIFLLLLRRACCPVTQLLHQPLYIYKIYTLKQKNSPTCFGPRAIIRELYRPC